MNSTRDAQVIRAALDTHYAYLYGAEAGHRLTANELAHRPELCDQQDPLAEPAAHTARSAAFAQRREFLEQLAKFPVSGLNGLTAYEIRNLHVPAHIGSTAMPTELKEQIAEREAIARRRAALRHGPSASSSGPLASEQTHSRPFATRPHSRRNKPSWHRMTFDEVLGGRPLGT